jgi:hypothetical protein
MVTIMAILMVAMGIGSVVGSLICRSLPDYVGINSVFNFVAGSGLVGLVCLPGSPGLPVVPCGRGLPTREVQ